MAAAPNFAEFARFQIPDDLMVVGATDEGLPRDAGEPRTSTQRNRDRIVWSSAFRRTGYKTQVFPHDAPDHFRRRLTHSIEVSQLATSLAGILHLNAMAAEAIALGHDLGHTAFGHAGEGALDEALRMVGLGLLRKRFPGHTETEYEGLCNALGFAFTHYDQGLRVVEYLEHEHYTRDGVAVSGLGLAEPVKDGILKHVRKDFPQWRGQDWYRRLYGQVIQNCACRRFGDRPTHLEGQAVAFADYLSYFISDVEDGILAKIIRLKDLERSALIARMKASSRAGEMPPFEEDVNYYISKRFLIKFLMLDAVDATARRLADVAGDHRSAEYALEQEENLVRPSDDVCNEMDEIYLELIAGKIHKHYLVVASNLKAARIIEELFEVFVEVPGLIPGEYRERNKSDALGHVVAGITGTEAEIAAEDLKAFITGSPEVADAFVARDYIAEMSDSLATKTHMRLMLSSEPLY